MAQDQRSSGPAGVGSLPVVFLAFANATEAHLNLLKAESREVYRVLQPLQESGKIALQREESCEFNELYDELVANLDRLVVFHYAGHANGELLQFEGGAGGREGLARLLGQQEQLKLVFLNGCATLGHVKSLLSAGVPAVIATSVPIGDEKAQRFSSAFYSALAGGASIAKAFESGRGFVEGQQGSAGVKFTRNISRDDDTADASAPVLEWGLYTRQGAEGDIEAWRLPDSRTSWEVQLTDADGPLKGPDGAPVAIELRRPTRSFSSITCGACAATTAIAEDAAPTCPICGSQNTRREATPTMLPAGRLSFSAPEDGVRTTLTRQLSPGLNPADVRLTRLLVPYWVFDVETRTSVNAERGWNKALGEVQQQFEWEPVRESIDLARHAYLVPAAESPVVAGAGTAGPDWYWTLDAAEPVGMTDAPQTAVPLQVTVQHAFDAVSQDLRREIDATTLERVGGQAQRNVTTDTRYRTLRVRCLWLPHWVAAMTRPDGTPVRVLVNGQTGALRSLQLPGDSEPQLETGRRMPERTYEPGAAAPGPSPAVSIFSGVGIGVMVGLLLGLSLSPIVGVFIGAVGTGLAALLGLNDAHFSTAKGLRIGSFGLALVLSAPLSIYLRAHNVLGSGPPSLATRKAELLAMGYDSTRVLDLLAATARSQGEATAEQKGGLFADSTHVDYAARLDPELFGNDPAKTLSQFRAVDDDQFQALADSIAKFVPSQHQVALVKATLRVICKAQDPKAECK
ncbi:MAG: CHAT domain-containing protein [Gemmatimonadaceae bacterium]